MRAGSGDASAAGSGSRRGRTRGQPKESLLFLQLDINAPCGQQLPPGGVLPESSVQEIRDWIAAGTKDD